MNKYFLLFLFLFLVSCKPSYADDLEILITKLNNNQYSIRLDSINKLETLVLAKTQEPIQIVKRINTILKTKELSYDQRKLLSSIVDTYLHIPEEKIVEIWSMPNEDRFLYGEDICLEYYKEAKIVGIKYKFLVENDYLNTEVAKVATILFIGDRLASGVYSRRDCLEFLQVMQSCKDNCKYDYDDVKFYFVPPRHLYPNEYGMHKHVKLLWEYGYAEMLKQ